MIGIAQIAAAQSTALIIFFMRGDSGVMGCISDPHVRRVNRERSLIRELLALHFCPNGRCAFTSAGRKAAS